MKRVEVTAWSSRPALWALVAMFCMKRETPLTSPRVSVKRTTRRGSFVGFWAAGIGAWGGVLWLVGAAVVTAGSLWMWWLRLWVMGDANRVGLGVVGVG